MKILYYVDHKHWEEKNRAGKDYTPAFIPELLTYLGVTGEQWTGDTAVSAEDILFVGAETVPDLPECRKILFGTNGADAADAVRCYPITDFYLTEAGEELPLFAPVLAANAGWEVLRITKSGKPALTRNGNTYRFCFDLPASVWYSGDGAYTGISLNGFSLGRTTDTRPLPNTMAGDVAYNDFLMDEIEDILAAWGVPMIYRLPPVNAESIPDFALHISGDDDCTSVEINLNAANVMHALGLPYHINAMPMFGKKFVFGKDVLAKLEALGCEVALHTDYVEAVVQENCNESVPYSFESQKMFVDIFEKAFDRSSVTNVNHWLIQDGPTHERLRWLEECGIIGDNGKCGEINVADVGTEEMNAFNLHGFSFGTAFPRYTLDDPEHANRHIHTMEIPINYYEPRLGGTYTDSACITDYLDNAAKHGRISQFFMHPHYFMPDNEESGLVKNVLALVKAHIAEKDYKVLYTTTDQIALFWKGRGESAIQMAEDGTVAVNARVPLVMKVPEEKCTTAPAVNGAPVAGLRKEIRGKGYRLFVLPACGEYEVTL